MIFHGEPNLSVMTEKEIGSEAERVFVCKFNGKGIFKTEDPKIIRKLTPHFRHDEERKGEAR